MKGVRTFLLVFGACALVAAIAAPYLVKSIWERFAEMEGPVEGAKRNLEEARAFAAEHEQSHCAAEAVRRAGACGFFDPWCRLSTLVFVNECLARARPTAGFCDDVPTHFMQRATWPSKQCSALDASSQSCDQVFSMVVNFCEAQRTKGQKRAPSRRSPPPS